MPARFYPPFAINLAVTISVALQIISTGTSAAAAEAAGKTIESLFDDSTVLFVSGGSSLSALEYITAIPKGLVVALADERFTESPADRNWTAFTETKFFARAQKAGTLFIPIPVDTAKNETESGELYSRAVDTLLDTNSYAHVIGLFGIGADGHLAGVFPYPEQAEWFAKTFDADADAVGYNATGKNKFEKRVTLSLSFIRGRMTHAIALSCGEEKSEALKRVALEEGSLSETPARILREAQASYLFTDEDIR